MIFPLSLSVFSRFRWSFSPVFVTILWKNKTFSERKRDLVKSVIENVTSGLIPYGKQVRNNVVIRRHRYAMRTEVYNLIGDVGCMREF